jgi:hypothetical protein
MVDDSVFSTSGVIELGVAILVVVMWGRHFFTIDDIIIIKQLRQKPCII